MEKPTLAQTFARNLRAAMDRNPAADTGQKVEARCGISQQHVSKLLRGLAAPTLETLELLAKAVGVQPWELLVDNEAIRRQVIERAVNGSMVDPPRVVPLKRKSK